MSHEKVTTQIHYDVASAFRALGSSQRWSLEVRSVTEGSEESHESEVVEKMRAIVNQESLKSWRASAAGFPFVRLLLSSGSVSKAAWTISQEQMVLRLSPAVPPPPPLLLLPSSPFPPFLAGWCHGKREYFLSAVLESLSLSVSSESRRPSGHSFAAVMWPLRPNEM